MIPSRYTGSPSIVYITLFVLAKVHDSKIIPLSKLAELFNEIMVSDYEIRSDLKLVKEGLPDYYESLRNVISFRFYMALKIHASQETWNNLMSDPEMSDIKEWFNDWIDATQNYHNKRIELMVKHVKN